MRRLHVQRIYPGEVSLDERQAHHARKVLRLQQGAIVEIFDDQGTVASGALVFCGPREAAVQVQRIERIPEDSQGGFAVASAVPKGERADWMIEKLSELGAAHFIPLAAARSVVVPAGTSKPQRWQRIAAEAAKQSRRHGVMQISNPLTPQELIDQFVRPGQATSLCLSTEPGATPIAQALSQSEGNRWLLVVGPEGGWTQDELFAFRDAGITRARLTATILRTETAAMAGAAVLASFLNQGQ